MEDYFEDLGVASYLGRQVQRKLESERDASRTIELFSNTVYEFRLDRQQLCVQDMDVLYVGKEVGPMSLAGVPLVAKHVRLSATDCRGVLYRLKQPVDTDNILRNASRFEGSSVIFERRGEDQAVKLQTAPGATFQPGQAYALYVSYTIDIAGDEPDLFFIGSIQPRDLLDIREKLGVSKAMKRIDLQLWAKQHSFKAAFYDGTDPVVRPPLTTVYKKGGLYSLERTMSYEISEEWHRSRYFGVFAQWTPPKA